AFKRLLGETSLERKCRFLFGGFTLILITTSFWIYARQTEHLAYEQIVTSCRLLMIQIVDRKLATVCRGEAVEGSDQKPGAALDEFRAKWEKNWPEALQQYKCRTVRPNARRDENKPDDAACIQRLKEFQNNK